MPRPPKKTARLYTRHQGGADRYYADLRPLGGKREALIPRGETLATDDPEIARSLLADRVKQLREEKRDATLLGVRRRAGLKAYAAEHLVKKAKSGKVTEDHLEHLEGRLRVATEFFGEERDLASIGVEHVQAFVHWLAERDNGRGKPLSPATQRKYLVALSNLFRRAQSEGLIRGVNPVGALIDKPTAQPAEAPWLEVWEAALLLEAAPTYPYDAPEDASAARRLAIALEERYGEGAEGRSAFLREMRAAGAVASEASLTAYLAGERIPARSYLVAAAGVLGIPVERLVRGRGETLVGRARPSRFMYPLLATLLLTGGRRSEVFGLELGDVIPSRGVVSFRPNRWRRLKTKTSRRNVPLWPQLREILLPWIEERRAAGAADTDLLFPSPWSGGMLDNVSRALDTLAGRVGWSPGEVRTKAFRHAYCSARLQTLDRGHPIADFAVAREMGHGGHELVRRVYGHLGEIRHRSEVVEYRIEQQREVIPPDRLRLLLQVA